MKRKKNSLIIINRKPVINLDKFIFKVDSFMNLQIIFLKH